MSKIEELLKNPPKFQYEKDGEIFAEIDYPAWTSALLDHIKELVGKKKYLKEVSPVEFNPDYTNQVEGYNQAKFEILQKIEKERESCQR